MRHCQSCGHIGHPDSEQTFIGNDAWPAEFQAVCETCGSPDLEKPGCCQVCDRLDDPSQILGFAHLLCWFWLIAEGEMTPDEARFYFTNPDGKYEPEEQTREHAA